MCVNVLVTWGLASLLARCLTKYPNAVRVGDIVAVGIDDGPCATRGASVRWWPHTKVQHVFRRRRCYTCVAANNWQSGWDRNLCKKVLYKVLWCRVGFVLNYSKTHHCWQRFYSLLCPLSGRELQADFHGEGGCFCALMNAYVEVGHLSNVLLSVWFFNLNPNVFKVKSYHQEFLLCM